MKRIITGENYLQLQEIKDNGEYKLQQGFALAGLTYKIQNNNIKFYLKEDYFYKNAIWSADIPLNIDGVEYGIDEIAEAMGKLFDPSNIGVTSVNGMQGDVTLTASDVNAYNKAQVDNLIDQEATARTNGDANLDKKIEEETKRAEDAEKVLQLNIESESNARQDADQTLHELIGQETTRATGVEDEIKEEIKDLKEKSGDEIQEINEEITNISVSIGEITTRVEQLETTINEHTISIENIEGDIEAINTEITSIENRLDTVEGDVTTLKTNVSENTSAISQLRTDLTSLQSRVAELESLSKLHLVASNIKSGTNIRIDVNGNDVTINTTGIPTVDGLSALEEKVDTNTSNITKEKTDRENADNSILTTLSGKAEQSDLNDVKSQSDANKTAIEGIQEQLASKEHFKGYFATNAEVQALTGDKGDFAYSAESGTKWAYNDGWTDTEEIVPDKTVEKSDTTPLMDGTATIGSSNKYATADHIHPTDISRASQSDFNTLSQTVVANTALIGQKANQSDLNSLETTVDGHTTVISNNTTAIANEKTRAEGAESALSDRINAKADATSLNNYYTKEEVDEAIAGVDVSDQLANYYTKSETYNKTEVDEAIAGVDVSDQLANYYTKTESDDKYQVKFTNIDDIQLVTALPDEPKDKTLYLIPIN